MTTGQQNTNTTHKCSTHHINRVDRQGLSGHQAVSLNLVLHCLRAEFDNYSDQKYKLAAMLLLLQDLSHVVVKKMLHQKIYRPK